MLQKAKVWVYISQPEKAFSSEVFSCSPHAHAFCNKHCPVSFPQLQPEGSSYQGNLFQHLGFPLMSLREKLDLRFLRS